MTMQFWKDLTEIAQRVAETLALLLGGFWTYWNYFKGRTFKPRASLGVKGQFFMASGVSYLRASVRFQNVGNGKFQINQRGTGLEVWVAGQGTQPEGVESIPWNPVAAFPVFEFQEWVEPKESVDEGMLLILSEAKALAYKLELRVVSRGLDWSQAVIIPVVPEELVKSNLI